MDTRKTLPDLSPEGSPRFRVYLIDDNEIDRKTILRLLRESPELIVVGEAGSLDEGTSGLKHAPTDVVLLDLNLPDSRGIDTLRRLRKAYPDQSVVVLTGGDDDANGRESIAAGAEDYLPKAGLSAQGLHRAALFAIERARRKDYEHRAEDLQRELELVSTVQDRLNSTPTPALPGLDIAGVNYTTTLAGGDYFDLAQFRDGSLAFIVADVSGHNFDASMAMFGIRRAFRTAVPLVSSFRLLVDALESAAGEETDDDQFATCFTGWINPKRKTLGYLGAGHDAWVFGPDGRSTLLDSTSPPLGTNSGVKLDLAGPIQLPAGHTLAVVTDGFHEAPSTSAWQFSRERVQGCIAKHRDRPAKEILSKLVEAVTEFCGSRMPRDDMSGVIIKSL